MANTDAQKSITSCFVIFAIAVAGVVAKVFIVILFTEVTHSSVTETCPFNGKLKYFPLTEFFKCQL